MSLRQLLIERFGSHLSAEDAKNGFFLFQLALVAGVVAAAWILRPSSPKSLFGLREADRKRAPGATGKAGGPDLATARIERKRPLQLTGIRIDGPPHEILGVEPGATAAQVQRAYRERMKQYHPDIVGRPGSREWEEAQRIAEAINRAKEEMLKRARGDGPQ